MVLIVTSCGTVSPPPLCTHMRTRASTYTRSLFFALFHSLLTPCPFPLPATQVQQEESMASLASLNRLLSEERSERVAALAAADEALAQNKELSSELETLRGEMAAIQAEIVAKVRTLMCTPASTSPAIHTHARACTQAHTGTHTLMHSLTRSLGHTRITRSLTQPSAKTRVHTRSRTHTYTNAHTHAHTTPCPHQHVSQLNKIMFPCLFHRRAPPANGTCTRTLDGGKGRDVGEGKPPRGRAETQGNAAMGGR